jgi:hypothetical protein
MMMVFIKEKCAMEKSMDQESIFIKMEIFMKVKCIKELCKEKENIHGLIKTCIRVLLFKTK